MKEPSSPMMRVRNWDQQYENNRSREIGRTQWVPIPNDLSRDSYVDLVAHEDGASHLGVWIGLLMVASRATPRGFLARDDGRPHTSESLARITRLPEHLIKPAIDRLLKIGLLEVVENWIDPENSPPAPKPQSPAGKAHPAGEPQDPATKPQAGAAEGKGTEHHHQEEKRNGKEQQRTEPDGTESAGEEFKTYRSSADSGASDFFQRRVDDEEEPGEVYASPEDELKAIYVAKTGQSITIDVLDAIRLNLELNQVTMGDFVSGLKQQHRAGNWKNPAGLLRSLSKNFRSKNRPASDPLTAAEADEKNYRCPICSSRVRGEGASLIDGRPVPCSCASPEWIQLQRERGFFTEATQ
jgi:hypothetical protein